jgi:hypothetical protein
MTAKEVLELIEAVKWPICVMTIFFVLRYQGKK